MVLAVDMDEVLVDFIGAAVELHGYTREPFEGLRIERGRPWAIADVLGLSIDEFWAPIYPLGTDFWFNLQPLPWITDLVKLLNQVGEWWIVSSPSRHLSSHVGKLQWINYYLPDRLQYTFINKHKHMLAKPGVYLLDDRPTNISSFEEEGGHGILFPNQGNHLYEHASDPVPYIESVLIEKGLLR